MKPYKYEKLHDVRWLISELELKPIRQIAEEVGCTHSAVAFCIRKYNITVPHRDKYRYVDKSKAVKQGLKERFPEGRFGEQASNWKGGRAVTAGGHIYVYSPEHPHRTKQGYVMEHRLVMEKHLGRYLEPTEDIHHINGDKKDNRIENLKLLSRSEHTKLHQDAYAELVRLRAILDKHGISY